MRWLIPVAWRATSKTGTKRRGRRKGGKPAHPSVRRLVIAGSAVLVVVVGHLVWRAGWIADAARALDDLAISASAGLGLEVEEVLLEGRHHTPRAAVLKAVRVKRGDPILRLDLGAVRARIESIPWVRTALVQRRWPGTVHIVIEERQPIAIWQRNRKLALVDSEGVPIKTGSLGQFRDLLVIVGKDAPRHAPGLLTTLEREPTLRERVLAAVRVGTRRWDIRFKGGVEVQLPKDNPLAAWTRLADLERRHGILSTDIELIDMRFPDRLIVRTKSPPPKVRPTKGRRT